MLTLCETGSPTGFALNEDDMWMGMMSPHGRNILDSAQVVGHSVNSTVPDGQNNHCPKFKTEFHPCSKCPMLFQSAEEFGQQNLKYMAPDCEPWRPFALEGNYIFATVTVEARLSSTQSSGTTNTKNAVPFAFILYADKTSLSSHGTAKGYPMVAHCANLPVHICNGEQYSGGCMVGWLPIVSKLVSEERKTGYVNFKHVIWHEAFYKLLEKAVELSKLTTKNFPFEELWDLSKTYKMCTTKQHQEVLALYEQKKSASEKKLKSLGLHPIKNVFWLVEHSEPEQAASFEPLHSLHSGLGGKHMHEELKIVVNELGHDFETCLEEW
ncbi:hypothetical protein F5J12DRAFT_785567 [Pisolithus orientalis]|uniref:uncharacterized protein n=1 Tax=Pisolithus orientalis TaxID=936130 RepID=UPI00222591A2|nr:uncharacterized protein F5J12DRAFT_785567 [Pisolithus orientalis]KAI5995799.1 hypothetical protein F5J12DRAFT_785567 [Pisolithus orientalis]